MVSAAPRKGRRLHAAALLEDYDLGLKTGHLHKKRGLPSARNSHKSQAYRVGYASGYARAPRSR